MPVTARWDWVAYVDETFNAAVYRICIVLIQAHHVVATQDGLDEMVARRSAEFGFAANAELHGSDLWHGSGDFVGIPPRVRRAIYDDALDIIVAAGPRIIIRGVVRANLRYIHPHRLSWRYAIETVDEEMEAAEGTALVVADQHTEMEAHLRGDIIQYAEATTGGWRSRRITRVLRTLRFRDSRENRLLQAADLVAFLYQRRAGFPRESNARAHGAREAHWAKLQPHVARALDWSPVS